MSFLAIKIYVEFFFVLNKMLRLFAKIACTICEINYKCNNKIVTG